MSAMCAHPPGPPDRRTAARLRSTPITVEFIVGPDLTFADAYATSVFVMGLDGLNWLVERHPDYAGFVITRDGTAISTPSFARHRIA